MANEITLALQMRVQNPAGSMTGYQQTVQQNRMFNQLAVGANAEVVSVPSAATSYSFSNLATPGFMFLQNLDPENFVTYGSLVAGTFYPVGLIQAGEIAFFRLDPGVQFAMKAGQSIAAPGVPTLSQATTGGTIAAGTYQAEITYTNASGESVASVSASVTTTGATSTITINSPAASGNFPAEATGWNAYVTQVGGSMYTLQNTTPIAIGTNLTLTAPPTSTGVNPPGAAVVNPVNINYLLLEN